MQAAGQLAGAAGLAPPLRLERLAGGKNNRVYRVFLKDGNSAALKLYHADPRDPRDRLGAEWNFLAYVWERGVRNVPTPLACDAGLHAGLYSFVPGCRLAGGEIGDDAVRQACDFVVAINGAPRDPRRLAPGSEACFSIGDHLATVDRRVSRLDALDRDAPLANEAAELVARRLRPIWAATKAGIIAAAEVGKVRLDATIDPGCVSPSDFGYHNALRDDSGRLTFIDFEYAGRDDPAKLVCDFFCQPEVAVPLSYLDQFLAAIAGPLALAEVDLWRCRKMLPAYRVKWVCIMLNEFVPIDASRRAFADAGERAARARFQIDRASRHLDLVAS